MRNMSKTIGIRVDEELDNELENLAESMSLKKSQLIKRAFTEWRLTREGIQGQNMMLVDSVLIAALFETLSTEEIKKIAGFISDHVISITRIRQIEKNRQDETAEEFLEHFSVIISLQHFGWFTNINYIVDDDGGISLYGFHTLNMQYSRYAVELLHLVLHKFFNYTIIENQVTVTENSFILLMKPPTK
jgi:hypothetical protein